MRPRAILTRKAQPAAAAPPAPGIRRAQPSELTANGGGDSSGNDVDRRLLPFVQRLAELIVADLLRTHGKER
jgi:hypothetical protein